MTAPCIHKILTCKGRELDPFNLIEDDIDIEEIAHSLAMQCRYNGATPVFYSVAEHCVIAADYVYNTTRDSQQALGMLLHDAGEAYIGDYVRPLKNAFGRVLRSVVRLNMNIRPRYNDNVAQRIETERDEMSSTALKLLRLEDKIERAVNAKYYAVRPDTWNVVDDRLASLEMRTFFHIELPDVQPLDISFAPAGAPPAAIKHAFMSAFQVYGGQL